MGLNLKQDESNIKWTRQDVERPEVIELVRAESLKVLAAELADIRLRYPKRRFEVIPELGYSTFDIKAHKYIQLASLGMRIGSLGTPL